MPERFTAFVKRDIDFGTGDGFSVLIKNDAAYAGRFRYNHNELVGNLFDRLSVEVGKQRRMIFLGDPQPQDSHGLRQSDCRAAFHVGREVRATVKVFLFGPYGSFDGGPRDGSALGVLNDNRYCRRWRGLVGPQRSEP